MKIMTMVMVTVLALGTAANAGDSANTIKMKLANWAGAVTNAKASLASGEPYMMRDPKDCAVLVGMARELGLKTLPGYEYKPWGGEEITLDTAAKICDEGDHLWLTFGRYAHTVTETARLRAILEGAPNPENFQEATTKQVKECTDAVKDMLANWPATTPFKSDPAAKSFPIGELQKEVCDPVQKFADAVIEQKRKEREEALARYAKAGITDDKADLMMEYAGHVFLKGGSAPDNLKKYGQANVLFVSSTSDPDDDDYVVHRVERYQFKANKLVGTTVKTYRKKRGAKLGNVFK